MTQTNLTHEQEMHVESHAPYMKIFFVLLIFTIAEYLYALVFKSAPFVWLILGLLTMAITKATLVGMYFMHLKFEGRWVYVMLIPAGCLAIILTTALIPDVSLQPITEENPDLEEIQVPPVQPDAAASVVWTRSVIG